MRSLDELLARHALPDRTGGKDDNGTVVVIGGPPACPGAALLAGTAALRAGCGRVQLVVDPTVSVAVAVAVPEALVTAWDQSGDPPDAVAAQVERADAVVIGPGHDRMAGEVVQAIVRAVGQGVVVLDAGALPECTSLHEDVRLVVAPNPSEAETIVGSGDEPALATMLSAKLRRPVAVRGATTVVADGEGAWVFDRAPNGLGTPGSGDVFTGALGALLASGMPSLGALAWAIDLHARAAARLSATTPFGYLARDIVDHLPHALADVRPTRNL